jgi:putative transcription antitermination factor YqgF
LIIVGSPISLKGEPTKMSHEIERFIERLKRQLDIAIELWDERFLSKYAVNALKSTGLSAEKDTIDRVAASIMLDEYLQVKRA